MCSDASANLAAFEQVVLAVEACLVLGNHPNLRITPPGHPATRPATDGRADVE
jgi:hypothetical protein